MNKRLGQHFLKNKSAITKIIATLDIKPNETIIEIGSGHGELTNELRNKNHELRIIAIEKDARLAQLLQQKFTLDKNIKIIQGDILRILPNLIHNSQFIIPNSNYKIVGNIPYYITGKLLRILSELKNKPSLTVLMIQKEVAERICAQHNKTNLLSAATQFWANPEIIFKLKSEDFSPAPKVDSAIIKLVTKTLATNELETKNYYKLIHIIFKQPRKTLLNNLKNGTEFSKEDLINILRSLNIPENCRPQNLTINNILELAKIIPLL
ncbi:ribosomal RNA small subunit methyltransferase A [Patescibacteria group bacterium]|nr:ribosomal RNA small subunit methyltransferase A [Patescibacteria group bacterium]